MLLTWLVEKRADVILVATANNIGSLPPELISRFSVSFWVDLPDAVQRMEIIKIHLKKVGRRANLFTDAQLKPLVDRTKDYSGREIEAAIVDSVSRAFFKKHSEIQVDDLMEAVEAISPTAIVKRDEMIRLREQAKTMGTKNASINHDEPTSQADGGRRIVRGPSTN